jgi:hypothetical protein
MATFPRREADIAVLAERMISGFNAHGEVFPHADPAALEAVREALAEANDAQGQARAAAVIKTVAKARAFEQLVATMKTALRQAQVDTAEQPAALELIGWGAKAPSDPVEPPAAPTQLHSVEQGHGTVLLGWKRPTTLTGGPVRAYILQRRVADAAGAFGEWIQIATAYETACGLTGQPRGVQLEYRVIATNIRGESAPSNTCAMVL